MIPERVFRNSPPFFCSNAIVDRSIAFFACVSFSSSSPNRLSLSSKRISLFLSLLFSAEGISSLFSHHAERLSVDGSLSVGKSERTRRDAAVRRHGTSHMRVFAVEARWIKIEIERFPFGFFGCFVRDCLARDVTRCALLQQSLLCEPNQRESAVDG